MRVLFATGTPAQYMAPPQLGDEQIVCGPDWPDQQMPDGRWRSLKTPVGEYNLATIAAKLPAAQKPDMIVCLVDASWRNLPRGLAVFTCPKVLLVADTHHLRQPLLNMLRYATAEPFTRIVLLYDRHHEAVFRSAGLRNIHWFPGLTFPHSDKVVRAARVGPSERLGQIAFVGQVGQFHTRRKRLVDALNAQRVAIDVKSVPQLEALRHYGRSLMGFNASLNGDLNLRVFEILATGGALLTDRLSPESGLDQLFAENREMITYGDPEELTVRAAHALAHPDKLREIGAAGARWFDQNFSEAHRREAFRSMAFDGVSPALFLSRDAGAKPLFGGAVEPLLDTVRFYELLQEIHRTEELVRVAFTASVPQDVIKFCETLPRVKCVADAVGIEAAVLVMSKGDSRPPLALGPRLCVWDARMDDRPVVALRLGAGWAEVREAGAALFLKQATVAEIASSSVSVMSQPDTRKHVAIYTDHSDKGRVASYNHELAFGLVARGYRVTMIETRSTAPTTTLQAEAGIGHAWIDYDTTTEFSRTITDTASAARAFGQARPDLVIFSDVCAVSNIGGKHATISAGIPFLTIVHNAGPNLIKRFANCIPVMREQFARAHEVLTISSENARLLHALFGLPKDKGKVIFPSASDLYFKESSASKDALRKRLGLPADAVISLTCAPLDQMEGFIFQVCAMEALRAQFPDSKLVCVWAGEGDAFESLTSEIKAKKLEHHIKLVGRQSNIVEWLDAADLCTLTSLSEGMPISIMEAMARGLPVVTTPIGGIAEALGAGGVLLPDSNTRPREVAPGLVKAWTELEKDTERRNRLGRIARERAFEYFQTEKMVGRIAAEIDAIVSALKTA